MLELFRITESEQNTKADYPFPPPDPTRHTKEGFVKDWPIYDLIYHRSVYVLSNTGRETDDGHRLYRLSRPFSAERERGYFVEALNDRQQSIDVASGFTDEEYQIESLLPADAELLGYYTSELDKRNDGDDEGYPRFVMGLRGNVLLFFGRRYYEEYALYKFFLSRDDLKEVERAVYDAVKARSVDDADFDRMDEIVHSWGVLDLSERQDAFRKAWKGASLKDRRALLATGEEIEAEEYKELIFPDEEPSLEGLKRFLVEMDGKYVKMKNAVGTSRGVRYFGKKFGVKFEAEDELQSKWRRVTVGGTEYEDHKYARLNIRFSVAPQTAVATALQWPKLRVEEPK